MDGTLTDSSAAAGLRADVMAPVDAPPDPSTADVGAVADGAEIPALEMTAAVSSPKISAAGASLLDRYLGMDDPLPASLLSDLDHPNLVLSDGYVGPDRRGSGRLARLRRATFGQRRSMLRVEMVVVVVVAVLVAASVVMIGSGGRSARHAVGSLPEGRIAAAAPAVATRPVTTPPVTTPPVTTPPVTTPPTTAPVATTAPAPATTTPAPAPAAAPAPATPAAAPQAAAAPTTALTPAQMGAQALTLVRYPWQKIPGYTIQFLSISQAPSPGFYGNTTFTWGRAGGTSVLYVYPGETVERLAGITAFEIGHEVDAAAVQPQGGEAQIENILGMHPASWAPNCDCAEQGFLSGWYSAAFSNYWSPGVGNWSTIAPEPTGAVLAGVQPWLNPTIS
jgi:hypothetical protein